MPDFCCVFCPLCLVRTVGRTGIIGHVLSVPITFLDPTDIQQHEQVSTGVPTVMRT